MSEKLWKVELGEDLTMDQLVDQIASIDVVPKRVWVNVIARDAAQAAMRAVRKHPALVAVSVKYHMDIETHG